MTDSPDGPLSLDYIPANIDVVTILSELNRYGWRDYKIEMLCGFSRGYVSQLKCGHVVLPNYRYAARLYNLWVDVRKDGPLPPLPPPPPEPPPTPPPEPAKVYPPTPGGLRWRQFGSLVNSTS